MNSLKCCCISGDGRIIEKQSKNLRSRSDSRASVSVSTKKNRVRIFALALILTLFQVDHTMLNSNTFLEDLKKIRALILLE